VQKYRTLQKKYMLEILHNPRCGKSRTCLAFLDERKVDYKVIKYLDNPLSVNEIKSLLEKLNFKPIDLVRQKESIWIKNFKGKNLDDNAIIEALHQYPILIERPIIIGKNHAFIARDLSKSEAIFNKVLGK
jgi:arsenate reductase